MTVAFWCVLVAILLPIMCAGIAKFGSANSAVGIIMIRVPFSTSWRGSRAARMLPS